MDRQQDKRVVPDPCTQTHRQGSPDLLQLDSLGQALAALDQENSDG